MASKENPTANSNNDTITILSVNDMSYIPKINDLSFKIPKTILNKEITINSKEQNTNLTLVSTMSNALINKDNESFLFCLDQKDLTLIKITIQKMDPAIIKLFMEKIIDIFQSSSLHKKNILPWMKMLFKYHKYQIMSMDKTTIQNLIKISSFIQNYTRNLNKLVALKQKLDKFNIYNNVNNNQKNKIVNEPLLTYVESEDEDESEKKEQIKNKMTDKGYEEVESSEEEEMEIDNKEDENDSEDEEDYFDIDEEENEEENKKKFKPKREENEDEDEEMSDD